ncbi:hypothetical protein Kpol_1052p23 [Vanderwaltozyma polyspora DSM 70294]|uniref:Uncharacterized protein n=1 Tax=Vanderwaltozyma polyspora (strain ATCC 22028 / DSM 70294 / BCRC 21397 / CBS 2163 / NBRC 10782 / NRRL Y-8283 / UCD 57-17) TaxID=436907 RepID=A7TM34_VANPO|nr:uncharacterized protein Kpol_1052p23 [Vanderwaltozyma polyspora DSM 70294]EDO16676.1 hypothetical protein Kpol_1052p23 [Vanderwaltozyma polyspora DSM 70294]
MSTQEFTTTASPSKYVSSMQYVETGHQRKLRKGKGNFFVELLEKLGEKLYWIYYIHLPFYLMTSFDSFCLHSSFLIAFTVGCFGFIKYCL